MTGVSLRRAVGLGAAIAIFGVATPASAWEAFCRTDVTLSQVGLDRLRSRSVVASICGQQDIAECAPGLTAARGTFLGEHRYIADVGLAMVGLGLPQDGSPPVIGYSNSPDSYLFDYATDGSVVQAPFAPLGSTGGLPTLAPGGPGGMTTAVARPYWLGELAEIPDVSHSLSDFLLGNESCLPAHALDRYADRPLSNDFNQRRRIDACHDFTSHMGAINSTHFGAQAAAVYDLYHGLAMQTAQRCAAMLAAFDADPTHPLAAHVKTRLAPACEREALAYQAVATHYLGDAWSSGHMWERWGTPTFDPDREGQLRQQVVGMISGLQHGWRLVAQAIAGASIGQGAFWADLALHAGAAQHDQLCMPGPSDLVPNTWVKWAYPGKTTSPQAGGGDLYLLQCTAQDAFDPRWAVAGASESKTQLGASLPTADAAPGGVMLAAQWSRMESCVASGFEEVYDAGPGAHLRAPLASPPNLPFDPVIAAFRKKYDADSTQARHDACFGQRATNRSMLLGAGITKWGGGFDNPRSQANLVFWQLPTLAAETSQLDAYADKPRKGRRVLDSQVGTPLGRVKEDMAIALVRLGFFRKRLKGAARSADDGTDLATLDDPSVASFLGSPRGSDSVPMIKNDQVEYFEPHDLAKFDGSPRSSDECLSDDQCQARWPGTYCDRSSGFEDYRHPERGLRHRCVRPETAVLRAFRKAETAYFCTHDTADDLESARAACQLGGTFDSLQSALQKHDRVACEQCATMVLPHLRNASNARAFRREKDRRAICDVLGDASALGSVTGTQAALDATAIYVPYDPTSLEGAAQAARYVCATQTQVPFDPSPVGSAPPIAPFLRAGPDGACMGTCGVSTLCYQTELRGPFESHFADKTAAARCASYECTPNIEHLFGAGTDLVDVAVDGDFGCAARSDGTIVCVGSNPHGELGNGTIGGNTITPTRVPLPVPASRVIIGGYAHGYRTVCAVGADASATLYCWGENFFGNVGDGGNTDRPTPVAVLAGVGDVQLNGTSCAVAGGGVSCWGYGATYTPQPQPLSGGITQLGGLSSCGLAGGGIKCWSGTTCNGNPTPVTIDVGFPIVELGSSLRGKCARTAAGDVYCWTSTKLRDPMATCQNDLVVADLVRRPIGKVDALSRSYSAFQYARSGRALYQWQAPTDPVKLPVAFDWAAPAVCTP